MDPLSITASCIAVAGAGGAAVNGLKKLHDLTKVPDILLSIINEVADLTLVVQDIRSSFQLAQDTTSISQVSASITTQLLDRAQATLLKIDQIINYRLLKASKSNGEIVFSRSAWILEERRVQILQASLRSTRLDLATRFAALSLTRTLHLEVNIQRLSLMTQGIHDSLDSASQTAWATQQAILNQLLIQLRSLQETQGRTQLVLRGIDAGFTELRELSSQALSRQAPSDPVMPCDRAANMMARPPSNQSVPTIGFKVQHTTSQCPQLCSCRCHTHNQFSSPKLLQDIIGALFIGYSRTPTMAPECSRSACSRHRQALITVIYVFPFWLLQRILLIIVHLNQRDGLHVSLRTIRTQKSNCPAFYYVESGNLMGLQSLFRNNEAGPLDVQAATNQCLLTAAARCMKPDICQFLLNEGADPESQVGTARSAADTAWDIILAKEGDPEIMMHLEHIFGDYGDLVNRNFTTLHKIVLGLDHRDLHTYLRTCAQRELASRDTLGYNALIWAARRYDSKTIMLLLEYGCDPNITSSRGFSALHFAAITGNLAGVNHLLMYGAEADIRSHYGTSPLQYACSLWRYTPKRACLQRWVEAGANVNMQDCQGATPMLYASQWAHNSALNFLLQHGADPNKPAFDGETPLIIAVQANSYPALPILLAHGANPAHYTLAGRSLLHEAAEYGDIKTFQLLTSHHIRGVEVDRKSSDGLTARDLAQKRADVTGEWRIAFNELLASVDETVDESVPVPPQSRFRFAVQLQRIPHMRLSHVIKRIKDITYDAALWIFRFAIWLLRLRLPIFLTLPIFMAVIWYPLTRF